MTIKKETKYDNGRFEKRPSVTAEDKRNIAGYVRTGINVGRKREDLIHEMADLYVRSPRSIERYVSSAQSRPDERPVDAATGEEIFATRTVCIDPRKIHEFDRHIFNRVRGDRLTREKLNTAFLYPLSQAFDVAAFQCSIGSISPLLTQM